MKRLVHLKMCAWVSLLVFLSWKQDLVDGIRILDIRATPHVPEGGSTLLGCEYDMEGDELYSVKWYKDSREFYRYVPNNRIPTSHFPADGVTVDISRSSSTVVALTNLTEKSEGTYRCEVSGEAPMFTTVYEDKYISVFYIPKDKPAIDGVKSQYKFGDYVILNCTSAASRPEAQLKWLINDRPVSKQRLKGPWIRIINHQKNSLETILELKFTLKLSHFKNGMLSMKCQAVIAPLYQEEAVYQIMLDNDLYSTIATPFEFTQENISAPSPISDEIKDLGFPPLDGYASEEVEDDVTKYQANLSYTPELLLIMLLIGLLL